MLALRFWAAAAAGLMACGAVEDLTIAPRVDPPCLFQLGEFPPTDCAFMIATVMDSAGTPLGGRAFRSDSMIGGGFHFASSSILSDAVGRLEIVVVRVHRLAPPLQPDTATVPLLLYPSLGEAKAGAPALARATVQLRFAPNGRIVDTTFQRVRFPVSAANPASTR